MAIYLYFVLSIDQDSFTEILELEKVDDKLISVYLNLVDFQFGKVLTFKGELVDVKSKYTDVSFIKAVDIVSKYEFLKDDKEKGFYYELLKDYIENIYLVKENLQIDN